MPTFDIVSEVDIQSLDNAINTAKKEILNRYDFNGSKSTIELDKKTYTVNVLTEDDMRMKAIEGAILSRLIKQGIDPACMDTGKEQVASGNMIRKDIVIKKGIDKETAKKVVKAVKESGLKVQASIMDEQVRVTGKKIDDLQATMAYLRAQSFEIPLQYNNFRS